MTIELLSLIPSWYYYIGIIVGCIMLIDFLLSVDRSKLSLMGLVAFAILFMIFDAFFWPLYILSKIMHTMCTIRFNHKR